MEEIFVLIALVHFALLVAGAALGIGAFVKVRTLQSRVDTLEKNLRRTQQQAATSTPPASVTTATTAPPAETPASQDVSPLAVTPAAQQSPPPATQLPETKQVPQAVPPEDTQAAPVADAKTATDTETSATASSESQTDVPRYEQLFDQSAQRPASGPSFGERFGEHLRHHWMIWLGGICVGLAGIFMVRYSIEQGLLGPQARIILSLLAGAGLHTAAEWLRRRKGQDPVFAGLAGGASIILYAALFAAFKLLPDVPPGLIFAALALVSFATLALALRHGPVLAGLGMLGGYLVPLLVNSGSGNIALALVYITILSGFSLWLLAYVQKRWLWAGVIAGSLLWWALSMAASPADGVRSLYLLVLGYLFLAVPRFDWLLHSGPDHDDQRDWLTRMRRYTAETADWPALAGLLLVVLAQAFTLADEGVANAGYFTLLLLPALLLSASRRPEVNPLTALMLPLLLLATFIPLLNETLDQVLFSIPDAPQQAALAGRFTALTVLYCAVALWLLWRGVRHPAFWTGLAAATPLLMLAAGYYLFTAFSADWAWGLTAALLGLLYLWLTRVSSQQKMSDLVSVILITAGHIGISLAAVILLEEATLTLALAAQLVSLSALQKHYQLAYMPWVIRFVLALVVCRLTFNPWLLTYPEGSHWSLWTYGGSTLCAAAAAWILRPQYNGMPKEVLEGLQKMQAWLQGGAAHLLVLTMAAEIRYWLYDGDIFRHEFSFTEASLDVMIWGAASVIYLWRSKLSQYLKHFYQTVSLIHLGLASATYVFVVLLANNPLWGYNTEIGTTPLWNLLLLSYGLPTLIMLGWWYLLIDRLRPYAAIAAGLNALLFISLEIRHLWQQGFMSLDNATSDGELYTYSVVWMLIAAGVMTAAQKLTNQTLYRAGMALLLIVVAKLFVIDMSGLTGLWRVASFMGLGLALLALAWLHQRFLARAAEHSNSASADH